MYTHLADYYDWVGSLDLTDRLLEKTHALLADHGITPPAAVLDLACGTGDIALRLAEEGYTVTGLDTSAAMLAVAQEKQASYPNTQKTLQWHQGDMRTVPPTPSAAVVTCYNDSLNHLLSPADVGQCFQAVYRVLAFKGLFLFDTNTLANYQQLWQGSDTDEGENYRLLFNSTFDEQTQQAHCQIRWEGYDDDHLGDLLIKEDTVVAQYFGPTLLKTLLQTAGFSNITATPFNPFPLLPNDEPIKTFWVAEK